MNQSESQFRRALRLGGARRLALSAATLGLLIGVAAAGPRNINVGDPIGTLKLNSINGEPIDSEKWMGRPSVWIFISPRQASSESALIALQRVIDAMPPPGVAAVALAGDAGDISALREFATRNRIRIPIAIDAGREQYGRLGIIVQPTTLVVNSMGKLHDARPGYDLQYERSIRADLEFLLGKIDEAQLKRELAATQPVRDLAREKAERYVHSASIMIERGLRAEAVKELQAAIEADPSFSTASLNLATLQLCQGDVASAEKIVENLLKSDPQNRQVKLLLGIVRFHQKRLDDALAALNEAMLLNPDPARTNYWLGRVYDARGEAEKARTCYRRASERLMTGVDGELARRP